MFVNSCDAFVCWWVVVNHFIYYLYGARKMELEKETGRMVLVAMVVASLAVLLASSLPGMVEWPGIH